MRKDTLFVLMLVGLLVSGCHGGKGNTNKGNGKDKKVKTLTDYLKDIEDLDKTVKNLEVFQLESFLVLADCDKRKGGLLQNIMPDVLANLTNFCDRVESLVNQYRSVGSEKPLVDIVLRELAPETIEALLCARTVISSTVVLPNLPGFDYQSSVSVQHSVGTHPGHGHGHGHHGHGHGHGHKDGHIQYCDKRLGTLDPVQMIDDMSDKFTARITALIAG